ncbi:MAG TPA: citrate synthase [Candidatus Onthomonas avicola]|nr:citrate synthase [Candidatus Onthomonas avicola]
MAKTLSEQTVDFIHGLSGSYLENSYIPSELYHKYQVKRGLRNEDNTGVMAGLTRIGNVRGYYIQDGERMPTQGQLIYRGIDVEDLIQGCSSENRFGFEETCYLLLMGSLPNRTQLEHFQQALEEMRTLPPMFTEDTILKGPSPNVMNKLARSILALYSYDEDPESMTVENQLRLSMQLIARTPVIVAHAYAAKRRYFDHESLYLHLPKAGQGTAETFLSVVRQDQQFTDDEAKLLDLCLMLHAEHGGGNNSTFTCRVISSSYTDMFSSIAAAVGSLKGPRHGGANIRCKQMMDYIAGEVHDWKDDEEICRCLVRLLKKEGFDHSGLIYGMGHAVYTLSDPRAEVLRHFSRNLAIKKGMEDRLDLIESVERLTPSVFAYVTGKDKVMCANVDLYSGFVYEMLNIPEELYTPLFATARMVGWCAHRLEEIFNPSRIIRPAYKAISPTSPFIPLDDRG